MRPNHHPDDSTLLSHAAGAIPESFGLIVAAHAESCPQCRARLRQAESIGGALIEEEAPVAAVWSGDFERLWQRISAEPQHEASAVAKEEAPPRQDEVPRALSEFLPGGLDAVPWRSLVPGVEHFVLPDVETGHGTVRLFRVRPGMAIPEHTHRGSEMTLILRGSFADELGRFQPGDVADLDDTVVHQPVADVAEPCICVIATDDKLRFSGLMGRLAQPWIGI